MIIKEISNLIFPGIFDHNTVLIDKNRGFVTVKEATQGDSMM